MSGGLILLVILKANNFINQAIHDNRMKGEGRE